MTDKKIEEIVERHFNNTVINCTWVEDGVIKVLPDVAEESKKVYAEKIRKLIDEEVEDAVLQTLKDKDDQRGDKKGGN